MTTVLMSAGYPASASFSIFGYRDVDAAEDKAAYFAYLDSFAELFRPMTENSVDLLRLKPGGSVLDPGCGHGACVPLLARRVGPSGRIVGIDASQAMVVEARRRFNGSGLAVEFRQGDAVDLPFDDASFDAARADRVFMFLDDPQKALSELIRVTKPGGRIVITEGDIGTHSVDSFDVATTRTVWAALSDRSPNGWIGRRLRAMFVEARLRDIDLQLVPILSTSFAEWNHRLGVDASYRTRLRMGGFSATRRMHGSTSLKRAMRTAVSLEPRCCTWPLARGTWLESRQPEFCGQKGSDAYGSYAASYHFNSYRVQRSQFPPIASRPAVAYRNMPFIAHKT